MLTAWRIQNFKAWRDTGPLKLAPLTVILGANSVGKSSLGHLLAALKQTTASSQTVQPVDFGDGQSLIDLGSFAQCLHQGNLQQPLSFELRWRLPETQQLQVSNQHTPCSIDELSLAVSIIADQTQQPLLQSMHYTGYLQEQEQLKISYHNSQPSELQVHVLAPHPHKFSIALAENSTPGRFYQLSPSNPADRPFMQLLAQQTEALLARFHTLKALRAMPQRSYHWDGEVPANVGSIGESTVAAVLAAQLQEQTLQTPSGHAEQSVQALIKDWLQQLSIAADLSITQVTDSPNHYQVLLKNHPASCPVNLADLGFGVSQLLPVLVQAFYAPPHSTLWLEQPETHLHPQVQAGLADVFIAAVQAREQGQPRHVQIITESHSEHFINRLQRRIAEGLISHQDVALYYCSRDGAEAKIEALTVDTYGEIANWPEHLFGDEMSDIAARAMAAVRRKQQLKKAGQTHA